MVDTQTRCVTRFDVAAVSFNISISSLYVFRCILCSNNNNNNNNNNNYNYSVLIITILMINQMSGELLFSISSDLYKRAND